MVGRSVNVDLRIKAQDEASKALDAVGKALKDLAGAQGALSGGSSGVGKFVNDLSKNVDSLSGVFKKLDQSIGQANTSYQNQQSAIASVNRSIQERRTRIEELAKSEADLQRIQGSYKNVSPAKQSSFVGPVPPRLSGIRSQLSAETGSLAKEQVNLEKLIGKSAEARSAILEIRNAQGQVQSVIAATTAAFLKQADALDRVTAAEKRAADGARVQVQVNAVTGVSGRSNLSANPSLAAQKERDLEATFLPILEREAAIQARITAERRAQAEYARTAVQSRINATTGVTGTLATAGGATFSALDSREAATATKEAADAFTLFEARAKEGAAALQQVQKYARDVAEALDPTARVTRLVAEEQERLAQAVKMGALSQDQAATQLARYKTNLDGTAAATDRQKREFDELGNYVQELRRDFDRAGYAEAYLAKETEKLNRAVERGILKQNEYGKALETVKRKAEQLGEQSNPQLLGLNPYQTQNLLYQVNDVATQLASGTSLTQTLSQQGGQILQLFPKVGNAIAGSMTAGTVAVAAFVAAAVLPLVVGLKEAFAQAERFRQFEGIMAAIATNAGSSVGEIDAAAKAIDRYGLSAEEAITITKKLLREGFDAEQIKSFAMTAKDMADVLGVDVNTALSLLTNAYDGNIESLRRLMDETGAFEPAQRQVIEAMYASGDAAGALDMAFGILSGNMEKGANAARGRWTEAWRNMGNAWDRLTEQLGNAWWAKAALEGINALADGLNWLAGASDNAREAEERRMNAYGETPAQTQSRQTDPIYGNLPVDQYRAANGLPPLATPTPRAATPSQEATGARLTEEARRQAILAKEVTSQAVIQERLAVLRLQENERLGASVSAQVRETLVAARVEAERVKLQKDLVAYTERQAQASERAAREQAQLLREQNTMQYQAKAMLRDLEDFRAKPYWDVNAWRVGYGSDTTTRPDGTTARVTQTTTTTREAAERDLARRIEEFANVVKQQIGSERFGQFGAEQQAALVSIAYNYGSLPDRILGAVRTGTSDQIGAAVRGLRGDNNGVNASRRDREAGILARPNLAIEQGAVQAEQDRAKTQKEFNADLEAEADARNRSLESQRALVGLQGEALLSAQREQAVQEAIAAARAKLRDTMNDPTAQLTPEQETAIRSSIEGTFDLKIPQTQFDELQRQLAALEAYKATLTQELQTAAATGDTGSVAEYKKQIAELDIKIRDAAASLYAFLNTPGNPEAIGMFGAELDTQLLKLTQLQKITNDWQLTLGTATITAKEFANAFTNSAVNAIDQFAQAVANGKNVIGSLWDSFRQFAADFLLQIVKMIEQQIIFNLVSGILGAVGGSVGGGGGGAKSIGNVFKFHGGGVVGSPSTYGPNSGVTAINPAWFATATRYHTGGIAGLKPNEVPSVLMRGEEVLTRDDPRHIMNGGGSGGAGNVKIVNAFDEGDVISKAMETKAGEKAVLNLVKRNPRAFKAAIG